MNSLQEAQQKCGFGSYSEKEIQAWRDHVQGLRKRFRGYRKHRAGYPTDIKSFILLGRMDGIEYAAAAKAADDAKRSEREYWLPILEQWQENYPEAASLLRPEIKRLRRILGIRQTPDERRAATLKRVQKHRQKHTNQL